MNTAESHNNAEARRRSRWLKCLTLRRFQWVALIATCLISMDCYSADPLLVLKRPGACTIWYEQVNDLAFSPDGKTLGVGSGAPSLRRQPAEATIELWDLNTRKPMKTLRQSPKAEDRDLANRVCALTFSPDGKWVIGGQDFGGCALWEVATGEQKFNWRSFPGGGHSPGWSPDGQWIALPSIVQPGVEDPFLGPNGIAVLEAATGKPKMFFRVKSGYAGTARISPDGRLLATAGYDCTVRVFDLKALTNVFTENVQGIMFAACFSPDSRYLVAGPGSLGALLIYEVRSDGGKIVVKKKGESAPSEREVHSVEFTPDGRRALSNSSREVELGAL